MLLSGPEKNGNTGGEIAHVVRQVRKDERTEFDVETRLEEKLRS